MASTLKSDTAILERLAFRGLDYVKDELRRYHRLIRRCGVDYVEANIGLLRKWLLVRITLWPINVHDLLIATHTAPWKALTGLASHRDERDFFAAYSGNSLLGRVLEAQAPDIDLAVCGHTHLKVEEQCVFGIRSLNIGCDYQLFRAVMAENETLSLEWIQ